MEVNNTDSLLQLTLMRNIRQSILENRFAEFVVEFMGRQFPSGDYEQWIVDALESVNIRLKTPEQLRQSHAKVTLKGDES